MKKNFRPSVMFSTVAYLLHVHNENTHPSITQAATPGHRKQRLKAQYTRLPHQKLQTRMEIHCLVVNIRLWDLD